MSISSSLLSLYGRGNADLALQRLVGVGEGWVANHPLSRLAKQSFGKLRTAKPSLSLPQGERGELQ